jgi:hypothetical protein
MVFEDGFAWPTAITGTPNAGAAFSEAAMWAVRASRYTPARLDGCGVAVTMQTRMKFSE